MNAFHMHPDRIAWRGFESGPLARIVGFLALALTIAGEADTFARARFDPRTDELVVTMLYRGTNPNHEFSLQWDTCPALAAGQSTYDIAAAVLDSQWNDDARQPFTKTVRFSLRDLKCRPARVTLRTAPHFYTTVAVPAAPIARP
jgi:hypothetical protein